MLITNYYDCLEKLIDDLANRYAVNRLKEDLRLADIQAVTRNLGKHDKALNAYQRWRKNRLDQVTEINEKNTLTVFQKLHKNKKSNTVFDRLKAMR